MNEPIKMYLRTVSPIHIGCDEVYEPMRFVIDEEHQKLIAFDSLEFFRNLDASERNTLATISKKGTIESLLEIYKFMRSKRFSGHEVELCKEFVKHYQKTLSIALHDKRKIQQELNNLTIARTAFNPNTDKPYIPGSGIKGALRTGYLNLLAATHPGGMSRARATAMDLEKTLLDGGSFETDPFRMLKVSDFVPVGQGKTKIVYAVNEKKKTSKFEARGPYQIVEVIEPGSFFQGWITIEDPDQKAGIANPITQKKLLQSLNQFYENEKSREDKELNAIDITPISIPDNNGWLVRIGRHSGAESITIEGHRNIKIMKGKGTPPAFSKNGATTFWLASEEEKPKTRGKLKPFGWAVLGDLTEDVEKTFNKSKQPIMRQYDCDKRNKKKVVRRLVILYRDNYFLPRSRRKQRSLPNSGTMSLSLGIEEMMT
jgi:CRISPR-associated RAMP protein, Csm5 family